MVRVLAVRCLLAVWLLFAVWLARVLAVHRGLLKHGLTRPCYVGQILNRIYWSTIKPQTILAINMECSPVHSPGTRTRCPAWLARSCSRSLSARDIGGWMRDSSAVIQAEMMPFILRHFRLRRRTKLSCGHALASEVCLPWKAYSHRCRFDLDPRGGSDLNTDHEDK